MSRYFRLLRPFDYKRVFAFKVYLTATAGIVFIVAFGLGFIDQFGYHR